MTETRTLTDIGRAVNECISLPSGAPEAPDLMLYHAALLVGDEEPRYVELVWEERADDLVGTLLIVTAGRVVRIVGLRRSLASPASSPGGDDAVQADTWPLSRLRALRLSGSLRAWHGVSDSSPLPAGCAWLLDFDSQAEPLRLPVSPNADRSLRQQVAALARDLPGQMR